MHRLLQRGPGGHCGLHIPQQRCVLQRRLSTKACIPPLPTQYAAEWAAIGTLAQAGKSSEPGERRLLERRALEAGTALPVLTRHTLNKRPQQQARSLSTLPPKPPQEDDLLEAEELLGLPSQPPPKSQPQFWWERDDAFRAPLATPERRQRPRKRASLGGGGKRAAPRQQQSRRDGPPGYTPIYGSWDVPLARDILTAGGAQQALLVADPAPGVVTGVRLGQPLEAGEQASAMQALMGSHVQHQAPAPARARLAGTKLSPEDVQRMRGILTQPVAAFQGYKAQNVDSPRVPAAVDAALTKSTDTMSD